MFFGAELPDYHDEIRKSLKQFVPLLLILSDASL